jgi:hypothetical protein
LTEDPRSAISGQAQKGISHKNNLNRGIYAQTTGTVFFSLIIFSCSEGEEVNPNKLYFPPTGITEWETISPSALGWDTSHIPG